MSSFFLLFLSFLLFFYFLFFFFNDTATTEIYTLSLHDALPISDAHVGPAGHRPAAPHGHRRSEEHTSELQSRGHLVCRLLLEKKKKQTHTTYITKKKQHTKQRNPITQEQ